MGRKLEIFAEVHDLQRVGINIRVHPVPYSVAKEVGYFPWGKAAGALGWPFFYTEYWGYEYVELNLHSTTWLSKYGENINFTWYET